MPCDYKDYPKDWKTVIRPAILERAGNKCEFCNIPNGITMERGSYFEHKDVYQEVIDTCNIYDGANSELIGADYLGSVGGARGKFSIIVLTIAHLDHNTQNNDYSNLKALCQRCHLRYDAELHKQNRAVKRALKQPQLF